MELEIGSEFCSKNLKNILRYKENGADHATEDDIDALANRFYENDSVDLVIPVSITKVCTEESEEKINILCPNLDMLRRGVKIFLSA